MSREYLVYTALLVISLVAAYLSSIADKTVGERAEITVLSVAAEDIETVHYYSHDKDFSLTRDDTRLVVEQTKRSTNQQGDQAAGDKINLSRERRLCVGLGKFLPLYSPNVSWARLVRLIWHCSVCRKASKRVSFTKQKRQEHRVVSRQEELWQQRILRAVCGHGVSRRRTQHRQDSTGAHAAV